MELQPKAALEETPGPVTPAIPSRGDPPLGAQPGSEAHADADASCSAVGEKSAFFWPVLDATEAENPDTAASAVAQGFTPPIGSPRAESSAEANAALLKTTLTPYVATEKPSVSSVEFIKKELSRLTKRLRAKKAALDGPSQVDQHHERPPTLTHEIPIAARAILQSGSISQAGAIPVALPPSKPKPAPAAQRATDRLPSPTTGETPKLFRTPGVWLSALPKKSRWWALAAVLLAIVALAEAVYLATRRQVAVQAAAESLLIVDSRPSKAEVILDGTVRGVTPIRLPIEAGQHTIQVRRDSSSRTIPLTIEPGSSMSQYIELPEAPRTGQLRIRTAPPGARIVIDGRPQGTAPMTIDGLAPGEHTVLLESRVGTFLQTVTVASSETVALVVPMARRETPAPLTAGWIAVSVPVEMQLFEGGQLIGSTRSSRTMVSPGRHEIEIVSEALGYRARQEVQVSPGKVASVHVKLPSGMININALPWAEVWMDGENVGETPIGNLSVPIGPHEIVFRHPQLGEQRRTATVTLTAPVRVSADLRK